ncbi:PREDICTED: O-linked-mannose beta-1 [Prunus dulcis]|uniref:PREDICTED: O-linked-mannose beta-1 n=1 Tax=Prunus dulcis TaxID=3755 RepID=A0A5E4FG48_PRUDU|nr:PREDICTED: O-linked-mannose beta-1 [Prunus dulcis]
MKAVTRVKILHGNTSIPPACNFTHKVPAVVFSSWDFKGNLVHEFNESIVPLFIMSRHFQSHLQFVRTNLKCWWGYQAARAVYVDGQNLKVNLVRFREMLIEAMKPLGGSTP